MNKLAEIIKTLPKEDLLLIKRDIEEGNLSRVLADRLAEIDVPQRVCPVCNTPLDDSAPYILYFGSVMRQKARFDGLDCLRTFLNELEADHKPGRSGKTSPK